MSTSNAKKFVEKLSKDKKFKEEFISEEINAELNTALKFAKKAGLECTAQELKQVSGGFLDWLFGRPSAFGHWSDHIK